MNRSVRKANTIKINLGNARFSHPADRSFFLQALKKTNFEWVCQMVDKAERGSRYEVIMMDLNDPPFDKDSDFSKKAEEVVATLATAENPEIRQAVARCIYTSRDTLMRLKDDEDELVRSLARSQLEE